MASLRELSPESEVLLTVKVVAQADAGIVSAKAITANTKSNMILRISPSTLL